LLRVAETGSGEVPRLQVTYKGKGKTFIMTGEIVTGAKQDRMSANDVVLGPTDRGISLAVYCVEQGRWTQQSAYFASGGTTAAKTARKSAVNKAGQGQIWNDVAAKSRDSNVSSQTGTMQAVYNDSRIRKELAAYEKDLKDLPAKVPDMVGFIALAKGQIMSADLFANTKLFSDLWPKLLKAAALDAVTAKQTGSTTPEAIAAFLDGGLAGGFKETPNPGLGSEYLIAGKDGITGSVLVSGEKVVHLALFADEKGSGHREFERSGSRSGSGASGNSDGKGNEDYQNNLGGEGTQLNTSPQTKTRAPNSAK
jgi:hypothetical protein